MLEYADRCKGKQILEFSDEINKRGTRLTDLEAGIRNYLSGDYPNPRNHRPGTCEHGTRYWELCAKCDTEHFEKVLAGKEKT